MIHNAKKLQDAIEDCAIKCDPAIERLRELTTTEDDYLRTRAVREVVELSRVLRRVVPELTVAQIHRAFGAPGDFGYDRPIGEALAELYGLRGGESS